MDDFRIKISYWAYFANYCEVCFSISPMEICWEDGFITDILLETINRTKGLTKGEWVC